HLVRKETYAGDIPAWAVEALHEPRFNRIRANREHDGNGRTFRLECDRGSSRAGKGYGDFAGHELRGERRQSADVALRKTIVDCNIAALVKARLAQALAEWRQQIGIGLGRGKSKIPDHRHR